MSPVRPYFYGGRLSLPSSTVREVHVSKSWCASRCGRNGPAHHIICARRWCWSSVSKSRSLRTWLPLADL